MTKTWRRLGTASIVSWLLIPLGCEAPPIEEDAPILNDWKKIIHVSDEGGNRVRQHVGYLHKQYSETDPEGIVFVLDVRRNRLGFVLPTGRAYAFEVARQEIAEKRDLGNFGFENGVRNILGLTGTLEYEPIAESVGPGGS